METIKITIHLASGETVQLEVSGAVTLNHAGSKEVQFACSGDVTLKVVDIGQKVTSVHTVAAG